MTSQSTKRKLILPSPKKEDQIEANAQYLKGVVAVTVEQGLGKARSSVLVKQLQRHGGVSTTTLSPDTTHVLVGNSVKLAKVAAVLKVKQINENIRVVRADWLSTCLKEGKMVDSATFTLRKDGVAQITTGNQNTGKMLGTKEEKQTNEDVNNQNQSNNIACMIASNSSVPVTSKDVTSLKRQKVELVDGDSDYIDSDDDAGREEGSTDSSGDNVRKPTEISPHVSPHKKGNTWICTKSSSSKPGNLNEHITEKLEVLEKVYKNSNDQWRALGYKKAIASIKSFPKKIETVEECRSLPFVGERLAKKIWEIVQTGHLQRLDHLDAKTDAMGLFCNLWGAGPKTAESWVAKGLKTLDDLREQGNLNRQQRIGLKYYDEFLERMPRSEAEEIGNVVKEAVHDIDEALQCVVCGSFRRGKTTCGDVDILISHPDGCSHKGVMFCLLQKLKENGFLTDDLTLMENQDQRKYLGVCLLPGDSQKHRRIDIIVVPYSEWACSLIYFTGSDYLNRSMRLLARKKGMSLSEHSLNTGVVRKGEERLTEGTPLPVSTEKDVFQYLGLDYLEPHERDW